MRVEAALMMVMEAFQLKYWDLRIWDLVSSGLRD